MVMHEQVDLFFVHPLVHDVNFGGSKRPAGTALMNLYRLNAWSEATIAAARGSDV